MSFIVRILIGVGVAAIGFLFVYKTAFILEMIGRIEFAERKFGPGGTRLFYKLLGTAIILVGFMFITNLFDRVIGGFLTNIFSGGI